MAEINDKTTKILYFGVIIILAIICVFSIAFYVYFRNEGDSINATIGFLFMILSFLCLAIACMKYYEVALVLTSIGIFGSAIPLFVIVDAYLRPETYYAGIDFSTELKIFPALFGLFIASSLLLWVLYRRKKSQKPKYICPVCNTTLQYVEQYQRWICPRCQQYF